MMSRAQRRRYKTMQLVYRVVDVGESLIARTIYDRIVIQYGSGHTHIPKSIQTLVGCLKSDKSFVMIEKKHNEWRRIE